ncbi:MAG: hypothetical protein M1814_000006 [Vezdaea aestivalis]|nr:MAG: hypothetical protein M1814_000006 [Vezdaea aestivalis]
MAMPSDFETGAPVFSPADPRPMAGALLDTSRPTAGALLARSDRTFAELLKRFDGLLALSRANSTDLAAAAAQKFQTSVETQGLIKAATDILELTRLLKQLWVQGELKVARLDGQGEDKEREAIVGAIDGELVAMLKLLSSGEAGALE